MMPVEPSQEQLANSLEKAGSAHHQFEMVKLRGERDEQWARFYAAYVLGQLGDFATPSDLSTWLEDVSADDDLSRAAATHVLAQLS